MNRLLESLCHGAPLVGDIELKWWCLDAWGSTYKERDFSVGCTITLAVCDFPHNSDTHTENS